MNAATERRRGRRPNLDIHRDRFVGGKLKSLEARTY
jgi:hypothetical protein